MKTTEAMKEVNKMKIYVLAAFEHGMDSEWQTFSKREDAIKCAGEMIEEEYMDEFKDYGYVNDGCGNEYYLVETTLN